MYERLNAGHRQRLAEETGGDEGVAGAAHGVGFITAALVRTAGEG
jgi:hypothetical protein